MMILNRRLTLTLLASLPPFFTLIAKGRAEGNCAQVQPVLLTIGGNIEASNRGATSPGQTGFFKHHGIAFEKGFSLDAGMLQALPPKTLDIETVEAGPGIFTGPALREVIGLAGVGGAGLRLMALDGYAVDLAAEEVAKGDWVLAIARDGVPLGLGDFGPAWLMRMPAGGKKPSEEESQRWVWSVFYIEVM